jgi:hypothetical protein
MTPTVVASAVATDRRSATEAHSREPHVSRRPATRAKWFLRAERCWSSTTNSISSTTASAVPIQPATSCLTRRPPGGRAAHRDPRATPAIGHASNRGAPRPRLRPARTPCGTSEWPPDVLIGPTDQPVGAGFTCATTVGSSNPSSSLRMRISASWAPSGASGRWMSAEDPWIRRTASATRCSRARTP